MSEMTLKEIDDEIFKLQTMRRELEKEEREKHKEAARKFVGKCYKYKDSILKVIDVPRTLLTMVGEDYNEYQFPAVFLQYPKSPRNEYIRDDLDDFAPCYCDNIYIDIKRGMPGCPALGECGQYQEISQEKFNAEFDKCIEYFKERIGVSKPKPMKSKV